MAEVERVKGGAAGTAGTHEVERVVNGSAGEVLCHRQLDGVAIVVCAQRNQGEMGENALPDDALDVGRWQARLERQRGKRGKEFGEAVGGQVALQRPILRCLQTGEGDGVVRVLLEQSRNESGSVKTDFHTSKTADFPGALVSLYVQKRSEIPNGRGNGTGADENATFLGKGRRRSDRTQTNPGGFNGDFQIVSRLQGKAVPDGFGHDNPAHAVEGDLHGNIIATCLWNCQLRSWGILPGLMDRIFFSPVACGLGLVIRCVYPR